MIIKVGENFLDDAIPGFTHEQIIEVWKRIIHVTGIKALLTEGCGILLSQELMQDFWSTGKIIRPGNEEMPFPTDISISPEEIKNAEWWYFSKNEIEFPDLAQCEIFKLRSFVDRENGEFEFGNNWEYKARM